MNLNPKLNLRTKILTGFGTILFLLLIVFGVSLSSLLRLGKASEAILKQNYLSIQATNNMTDAIAQHYRLVDENLDAKSDSLLKLIYNEQLRFEHWIFIERGNITEEGEAEEANNLLVLYKKYLIKVNHLMTLGNMNVAQSRIWQRNEVLPIVEGIRNHCMQIRSINERVMIKASASAKVIAHRTTMSLIIIGLISVVLAIIFSLSLSFLIVKPLNNILLAVNQVASGDYSVRIEHHSSDEFGIVSNEFNRMVERLNQYHELNIRNILSEKQITEAILQNMDDGLLLLDTDYHIRNINLSGAKFFYLTPSECIGKHILEIIKNEFLFTCIKETAQNGASPKFEEAENLLSIDKDNNKIYLQFQLTPVFEQGQILLGVMILLQDITRLKQLDKLKSEFLMIASHELKTPLTSINMSLSLLKEKAEHRYDESEKELLEVACEDTQRLKALINDLLDISKIEAGKIDLSFENISVDLIFETTQRSFQSTATDKEITFTYNAEPHLVVRGDFGKIAWIMSNLISNAVKFVTNDGKIDVSAKKMGNFVLFCVKDNGIGIQPEYQNKIFDKFFQVPSPLNSGGTGLGLSICKEIVRAHGGTVWVESEPNQGSSFYFTLPIG